MTSPSHIVAKKWDWVSDPGLFTKTVYPSTKLYLSVVKMAFQKFYLKRYMYIFHKPQFIASLSHLTLKEIILLKGQEAKDLDMVFF